ncbi:MAG: polymerase subunit sigma-70 [Thermoleophilia bacterium]|nr:polymerase subunit sigma-70 [Thermoleophilia bacterium]
MTSTQQHPVALETDAHLLGRASAGDEAAFRVVYDRHVDVIRGYARGRVGPDAADDIVSESFAVAWRSCSRFDPTAMTARPWLYGIATKVMARYRESEQRWIQQQAHGSHDHPVTTDEPTAYELDPALCHAIGMLSPALRDTLLLTALGELSVAETGRALGITATTARVRLLRARRLVRQALKETQP